MKKILMLTAAALVLQATPVLAGDYKDSDHKGKMFEKQDTNGDGVITESEFLESAKERFKSMDLNGDGSVTKEEGREAMEAKRKKWKEKREERMEKRKERKEERSESDME
jgi:Ca2+-binding EF-hand superfamily protein